MAQSNRCSICGSSTWCGRPCFNAPATVAVPRNDGLAAVEEAGTFTRDAWSALAPRATAAPAPALASAGGFDKRAYMREYMRRRRAKASA
jgi:hypothetical protein